MKKLYTKYLREIIDANRNNSRYREIEDKSISRYDSHNRKSNAKFRFKEAYIVTERGISMSLIDSMISMGCKYMVIIKEMHEMMIDDMKRNMNLCHNMSLNKSLISHKYNIRRATIDEYIKKLVDSGLILREDDGTYSLSFALTPFNVTEAVKWHELKVLEYVSYGMVDDIVERQSWLYDRFTTVGYDIVMTDYGVSFDWDYYIFEAYFYCASVVWFGAGENKPFCIDVDRMIGEAAKHNIEVTSKEIRGMIERLCNTGYMIRLKSPKAKITNQIYQYTDRVKFLSTESISYEL